MLYLGLAAAGALAACAVIMWLLYLGYRYLFR
jgi:hypothetical protein